MDTLIALLSTLNNLSPLAIIGLLGTIIFMMVKGKTAADGKVETIATNHLHELPEIADTLRQMAETLRLMETKMAEGLQLHQGEVERTQLAEKRGPTEKSCESGNHSPDDSQTEFDLRVAPLRHSGNGNNKGGGRSNRGPFFLCLSSRYSPTEW